jgi:hypothetical protein
MQRRSFLATSLGTLASGATSAAFAIGKAGKFANSKLTAFIKEPVRKGWEFGETI